jgi:UDP-N-acetylglucosamine transferase subunit ALG13
MTTLYLATSGGHLAELLALERTLPPDPTGDNVWLTDRSSHTTAALRDRDAIFVRYVRERNVVDVARCIPHAHRLLVDRGIDRAISTGSGIALGYLPYLASRGVECHYIESAARVSGPSLTGRFLRHVPGVNTHTQQADWADRNWAFVGSVFDGYQTGPTLELPDRPLRVVVTVGSASEYPFSRLIERLSFLLAANGPLARATGHAPKVLWQTGPTPVAHLGIESVPFVMPRQLAAALEDADIVVSHAGVGSAIGALDAGKVPVLVPRDHAYGEAGDDHQHQLAAELGCRDLALRREPYALSAEDLLDVATRSVEHLDVRDEARSLSTTTTLLLATTGGHLAQLDELAPRLHPEPPLDPGDRNYMWVTHENEQSRSLLASRPHRFVPYVGVRAVRDVLRCIPDARRLVRDHGINRAVSTGSGIALGYLPYLAARRVDCHYIESVARVSGPSLTGRIMRWVPGVRTYTQHRHLAGGQWRYHGSVLDGYGAEPVERELGDVVRVVVTVGTAAEFPFRRMIERLVPLLEPDGDLHRLTGRPVQVLWQTGCTDVDDLPIDATPFLPAGELRRALGAADIVLSHAGAGSALAALDAGRAPALFSRTQALGEAGDDHQAQLATELAARGLAFDLEPETVTADDLFATLKVEIVRLASMPAFEVAS